ncbi:MAG: YggT family protein [Gammaproteobacteria bacterium]|jgi:YggT family protein
MTEVLYFVSSFLLQTVTFLFIARFLLQACRVDFYNPISQGIVKVTDPVLRPMRMVLPGYRNLDFSSFLAAVVAQILLVYAVAAIGGLYAGNVLQVIVNSGIAVLLFIIRVFWWGILIMIIASFVAPASHHPALLLLHQVTEPLLAPARRLIPPMGGLDFSPILVFLLLGVIERALPYLQI